MPRASSFPLIRSQNEKFRAISNQIGLSRIQIYSRVFFFGCASKYMPLNESNECLNFRLDIIYRYQYGCHWSAHCPYKMMNLVRYAFFHSKYLLLFFLFKSLSSCRWLCVFPLSICISHSRTRFVQIKSTKLYVRSLKYYSMRVFAINGRKSHQINHIVYTFQEHRLLCIHSALYYQAFS